METIYLLCFLAGLAVEFAVCRVSRKSKNRDIWRLLPMLLLTVGDFLFCLYWNIQSSKEFHEQGNCLGGMLYVIFFFAILLPPLVGMGVGRLINWTVFETKKQECGGKRGKTS